MKIDEYKQMMSFLLNPKHIHHGTKVVQGVPYVPKGYADGGRVNLKKGSEPQWLERIQPVLNNYNKSNDIKDLMSNPKNKEFSESHVVRSFRDANEDYLNILKNKTGISLKKLKDIQNYLKTDFKSDVKSEIQKKSVEARKQNFITGDPKGQRLNWIAENSSKYDDPKKMIKDYLKKFNSENLQKDLLFKNNESNRILLDYFDNLTGHSVGESQDRISFKPGYSEDKIFKAAIIQNNPKIQKQFNDIFKNIYSNYDNYKNYSIESLPNKIPNGDLLDKFDFIQPKEVKGTKTGELSGINQGAVRRSLINNANVPQDHLDYFAFIKNRSRSVKDLLQDVKRFVSEKDTEALENLGLNMSSGKKIAEQYNNFILGQRDSNSLVKDINEQLPNNTFRDIYGGVNFEHVLAQKIAKDLDYLPRDYLLRGQFTTKNFNLLKRDEFDVPLINMMKEYKKDPTKEKANEIQDFIDDFNSKTNDYANFKLNPKTKELEYFDNKPNFDLSRYAEPGTAKQELLENLMLGGSEKFQKAFKESNYIESLKLTPQIKKILNNLGLESKETEALFKLNNTLNSGLNLETFKILFPEVYDTAKTALEKAGPVLGKSLTTLFSPAITALSETGALGAIEKKLTGTNYLEGSLPGQIKEGKSIKDIATNPETYLPYAFMSNAAEIANPVLRTALTLGLPEEILAAANPVGLGLAGAAGAYQVGKAIKNEYERIGNLSPEELKKEKAAQQPEPYYIPEAAGQYKDGGLISLYYKLND